MFNTEGNNSTKGRAASLNEALGTIQSSVKHQCIRPPAPANSPYATQTKYQVKALGRSNTCQTASTHILRIRRASPCESIHQRPTGTLIPSTTMEQFPDKDGNGPHLNGDRPTIGILEEDDGRQNSAKRAYTSSQRFERPRSQSCLIGVSSWMNAQWIVAQ
jgi:hypothetical protein